MLTIVLIVFMTIMIMMPCWMAWRREYNKPYLGRWFLSLVLCSPFIIISMYAPDLLHSRGLSLINFIILLPFYVGISAFIGGLAYLLVTRLDFSPHEDDEGYYDLHDYLGSDYQNNWKNSYYRD